MERTQVQGQVGGWRLLHDNGCFLREPGPSDGAKAHMCKHTCAQHTHIHTHTHSPGLWIQAQELTPHHAGDTAQAKTPLPSQKDAQRDWTCGLYVPSLGVIVLDFRGRLAKTWYSWLHWESGVLDSKPPLCLLSWVSCSSC